MNENRYNYPFQFALLIGLMGLCLIFAAALISLLGTQLMHVPLLQVSDAINKPENLYISQFLNTLASIVGFLLPVLILARLTGKRPFTQLGFNRIISNKQLLLVVLITFASMVLGGALGELNEKIPLPAKWLAKAKAMEDAYKAAMMGMAQMKTFGQYIMALIVLGVGPAICEETLFRGGFQQIFIGWTKNKWAGIIITGIFFSAIHFSYFGFLPRAVLGIVLGLVFYYSKNIWLNIFLHFLNNAFVVTQLYLMSRKGQPISKTIDESMPMWWGAIAIVLLVVFMRPFREESEKLLATAHPLIDSSPENPLS